MSINPDNITTIRVDQLAEATLNLTNEFPHSDGATLKKATIQSLVDLVATAVGSGSGVGFLPISVTDGQQLPNVPTDPSFFLCGPGTYLNINGYPNVVCTDELNAVMSLTDHWQLSVGIPITADLQSIGISQSVNNGVLDKAPSENAVYDFISQWLPKASLGYFDYADLATQTTPITVASGVQTLLTNDTLGDATNTSQPPYGVNAIWDADSDEFNFSQLSVGDTVDIRVHLKTTTTSANQKYHIDMKFAFDSPDEFENRIFSQYVKNASEDEQSFVTTLYIGSESVRTYPARLYITSDDDATVEVVGWFCRVFRKSVNIVDLEDPANLISTDPDNAIELGTDGKLWSGGGSGGSVPDATESTKGKAQIATEAEAISGVNDTKIVTPAKLAAAFTDRDLGYSPENVDNKTNTVSGNETSTTLYPSVKGLVDWIASRGFITSVITALGYTPENSANKGAANGYVPLNSSIKIDTTYLPDSILGQLLYGGVVDASTAIATLTNNAKSKLGTGSSTITLTNNTTAITGYASNESIYYIATVAGTFASISFEVGDWLLSIGSAWVKVDNTDAIASFNTRTGAIVLLNTDVLPLLLSGLSAASGTFTSSDTILTAFGKIKYLIDNIASTYQAALTDVNFGSFSNGLTGKTTPVDADSVNIVDSADSNKAKKVSLTNFKAFLKTYFDGLYSVPCITITTSVSIDTDTTSSSYGQHGRNTKIANSTNAINLTVQTSSNADFVASYTKIGSATITFVAGSGATLVQLSGTAALTGSVGSTACLTRNGNTYYLQITNY